MYISDDVGHAFRCKWHHYVVFLDSVKVSKQVQERLGKNVVNKGKTMTEIIRDYMSASITEVSYRQPPLVLTLLVVGPS